MAASLGPSEGKAPVPPGKLDEATDLAGTTRSFIAVLNYLTQAIPDLRRGTEIVIEKLTKLTMEFQLMNQHLTQNDLTVTSLNNELKHSFDAVRDLAQAITSQTITYDDGGKPLKVMKVEEVRELPAPLEPETVEEMTL